MPTMPSPVFNIISKTPDACGKGTLEFLVQRLINTANIKGSNVSYSLNVGSSIDMIIAGVDSVGTPDDYNKVPSHRKNQGF
jgi:hypothetical protein